MHSWSEETISLGCFIILLVCPSKTLCFFIKGSELKQHLSNCNPGSPTLTLWNPSVKLIPIYGCFNSRKAFYVYTVFPWIQLGSWIKPRSTEIQINRIDFTPLSIWTLVIMNHEINLTPGLKWRIYSTCNSEIFSDKDGFLITCKYVWKWFCSLLHTVKASLVFDIVYLLLK